MSVCEQFVLFVGVTILLASTYVTMMTQEKLVQQESVIKVAKPIDEHLNNDKFDHHLKQLHGQWLLLHTWYSVFMTVVLSFITVEYSLQYSTTLKITLHCLLVSATDLFFNLLYIIDCH